MIEQFDSPGYVGDYSHLMTRSYSTDLAVRWLASKPTEDGMASDIVLGFDTDPCERDVCGTSIGSAQCVRVGCHEPNSDHVSAECDL